MHEVFHILGLCPDSFSHLDVLDMFIAQEQLLLNRSYLRASFLYVIDKLPLITAWL